MAPLTGSQAAYGTFIQQGQMLFAEEFNKAGGFRAGPEKGKLLKMLYEDDGEGTGAPDTALSAFRKLVDVDRVKAVSGIVLSSVALPLAPIAEAAKCVVVSIDPTTPKLSQYKNFFRITETSDTAGPSYAGCVYKAGFKNISLLWVNDPAGAGFHDTFIPAFERLGGKVVLNVPISVGGDGFQGWKFTKCMVTNPDCNVMVAHEGDILVMHEAGHRSGLRRSADGMVFRLLLRGDAAEAAARSSRTPMRGNVTTCHEISGGVLKASRRRRLRQVWPGHRNRLFHHGRL